MCVASTLIASTNTGAHIRVVRGSSVSRDHGLYDHHMLVVHTDRSQVTVIHYTQRGGEGLGSSASFSSFGDGGEAEVIEEVVQTSEDDRIELLEYPYHIDCFLADEAIERARTKLGEKSYGIFDNNCECLVNWALTGQSVSIQSQSGSLSAGFGALAGAISGYSKGSWSGLFKGAVSGAQKGYLDYREKRH